MKPYKYFTFTHIDCFTEEEHLVEVEIISISPDEEKYYNHKDGLAIGNVISRVIVTDDEIWDAWECVKETQGKVFNGWREV